MEKMTIKQAIEQGYTHYGYAGEGYQRLGILSDIDESCFIGDQVLLLASKEIDYTTFDKDDIAEIIADHCVDVHCTNTGDDDGSNLFKSLKTDIDYSAITDKINEFFTSHWHKKLINIELVK